MPNHGHTACASSYIKKFVAPLLLNDCVQYVVNKFKCHVPFIMAHTSMRPLSYDKSEKLKVLKLGTELVLQEEHFEPR